MKFTFDLTPQQVSDFLHQVAEQSGYNNTAKVNAHQSNGVDIVSTYILALGAGAVFNTPFVARMTGVKGGLVSRSLRRLAKAKEVKMIVRGTWRRL